MDVESIFAAIKQGILVCDKQGRIVYFNESYSKFTGLELEDVKGRELKDLRPGAVVPDVLTHGQAVERMLRVESDQEYFADVYPVYEDSVIIGTISVVTYLTNANDFREKLSDLERNEELLKERLEKANGTHYQFDQIIGSSLRMIEAVERAKIAAASDVNVLLQGESGCGKELFAQSIHNASQRHRGLFVAVNCATLSKNMLESELFGYETGAFTGAKKGGKPGLFEVASGGTLFLDEISEMDYELQAKLLRVLQERKFRRIGGQHEIKTDVRIICACNVDLQDYIREKRFRLDLFYRIAVFPLIIPPLRERKDDIDALVDFFLKDAQIQNKRRYTVSADARRALHEYNWPGNIRELRNVVEYSALVAASGEITPACMPILAYRNTEVELVDEYQKPELLSIRMKELEKQEINRAINYFGDNTEGKRQAAKALGISLSSLYNKLGR